MDMADELARRGMELAGSDASEPHLRERYLGLLKQVLTFSLWDARDGVVWGSNRRTAHILKSAVDRMGFTLVKKTRPQEREFGRDWPRLAHTMVGTKRLDNIQECVETILADRVPGDLIETGVWRGGVSIFMRALLAAHGIVDRDVWLADSFAGLPPPNIEVYPDDEGDSLHTVSDLAISMAEVRENFERYGLLDEHVRFLPGWFKDTLPCAPMEQLALLRLDGDMYGSTIEALEALYPKLSPGGFCIIDDYGAVKGCRRATDDYRTAQGIKTPLIPIDSDGVYWRKSAQQ